MKMNILVGQSGGPSAAINATLAGVIKAAAENPAIHAIYGTRNGIDGVLTDNICALDACYNRKDLERLCRTPAMALGSCRVKLPAYSAQSAELYEKIHQVLQKHEIRMFFYIGGNDSMDTVLKLSCYFEQIGSPIKAIGIPKTIDNDLCLTDHTPGYGSSAKYLCQSVSEIICDSRIYPVKNVVIVEVMGRNSGWLTLAAALPRFFGRQAPQIIALPEVDFDEDVFLHTVNSLLACENTVVAVVSEGVRYANGEYVGMSAKSGEVDIFGHAYLSGVGKYLEKLVSYKIGCKVRSVELNVLQRCASHLSSAKDLEESVRIGEQAVTVALSKGLNGVAFGFERQEGAYRCEIGYSDVALVANQEKRVPKRWQQVYDPVIQKEIIDYIFPLMQGEVSMCYDQDGMPDYLEL